MWIDDATALINQKMLEAQMQQQAMQPPMPEQAPPQDMAPVEQPVMDPTQMAQEGSVPISEEPI